MNLYLFSSVIKTVYNKANARYHKQMHVSKLQWEKLHPEILGLITIVASYFWLPYFLQDKITQKLMEPTITISAIGIGFLSSLLATIFASGNNEAISKFRTSNRFEYMRSYAIHAIAISFVLVLLSALILIIDGQVSKSVIVAIWNGVVIASLLSMIRISQILIVLL